MLAKTVLVMYLITGHTQVQVQYVARFQTEAACQAEARKYVRPTWATYPVQEAACVFDVTNQRSN